MRLNTVNCKSYDITTTYSCKDAFDIFSIVNELYYCFLYILYTHNISDIQIFNSNLHPEFGNLRTLTIDGEPWFVGKDVAEALGYKDTDQAIRKHVENEDKLTRQINGVGQKRNATIINESGLYSLILSSKLEKAKIFKHWVTSEVLPTIRKTGGYINQGQEDLFVQKYLVLTPHLKYA